MATYRSHMALEMGLDAPSGGSATVNGRAYRKLPAPLYEVGRCWTPGPCTVRKPHDHLLCLTHSNGIPGAGRARC